MSTIAGIRFHHDKDKWSNGLRCWRNHRSIGEFYWKKYWDLPSLYFTLGDDDGDGPNQTVDIVIRFLWFSAYVPLFKTGDVAGNKFVDETRNWGWYWMDRRSLWGWWGKRHFSWNLPFLSTIFVKHEILSIDRAHVVHNCKHDFRAKGEWEKRNKIIAERSITLPYRYETLSGKTQDVTATVHVERWTRRIKWTPFKREEESINVSFSEEVGPERGSWKGGCTGCGYTLRPNETAVACLRRMERERRFER